MHTGNVSTYAHVLQVSSRSHAVLEVVCVNEPADAPTEGEEQSDDMGTDG